MDWNGKVVWITGGGSGIGKGLALELASRGAHVAVSGRRQERLDELVAELEAGGTRAIGVRCDVTAEADVEAAAAAVIETLGRIDVAIANAGFAVAGRFEKLTAADWRRQLEVNVIGAAVTIRQALPALRQTRGRAVLVSSIAGMIAAPGYAAYNASKYAVRAIGQTLAAELHGSGVTCTTIYPGFVESEIAQVDNEGVFHAARKDRRPTKLMWPTDRAARVMADAIAARRREYVFTGHGKIGAWLGRHMPGLAHIVFTRGARKKLSG